jgi:hypothetical protein
MAAAVLDKNKNKIRVLFVVDVVMQFQMVIAQAQEPARKNWPELY